MITLKLRTKEANEIRDAILGVISLDTTFSQDDTLKLVKKIDEALYWKEIE